MLFCCRDNSLKSHQQWQKTGSLTFLPPSKQDMSSFLPASGITTVPFSSRHTPFSFPCPKVCHVNWSFHASSLLFGHSFLPNSFIFLSLLFPMISSLFFYHPFSLIRDLSLPFSRSFFYNCHPNS